MDLSEKMSKTDKDRHFKTFNQIDHEVPFTCHACGKDVFGQKRIITAVMLNRIVNLCNKCGPVVAKFNDTVRVK